MLKKEDSILKERKPLDDAWYEVITALQKDEDNQILKSKADSIHNAFQPYRERIKRIDYQFIASNPDSYVSPYILIPYIADLSVDSAKEFYKNFTERIKNSRYGKSVINEIKRKMVALPGDAAKDFITKDINGNPLSLSSFKGQNIVLLDFWASWCIPCRRNNPHLIKLYSQYHSKGLEIIGIAMDDDNPDAWKKAISKDGTGIWHQILQGKDKEMIMKRQTNKNERRAIWHPGYSGKNTD